MKGYLGVNEKYLSRWRKEVNFQDPLRTEISDEDLDELVKGYVAGHGARGEKMIDSCLAVDDSRVTRTRLRASMKRVDPLGIQSRKAKAIHRRQYHVEGPHHLWHVDGNHKLIKFNMVVHAGIDGFSRALLYARCSDNNRAETAFVHFKEGVDKYGCPNRVRTDLGGENVEIANYMVETKGLNRGSILTGKSTHNQRIERQWRDMTKEVISYYRELFFDLDRTLERGYNCSFSDLLPLWCLHYMFLPRINADLQRYMDRWNIHKIRTEQNKCPARLLLENAHLSAAEYVDVDDENYGLDLLYHDSDNEEGNYYDSLAIPSVVMDPPVNCPLNQFQLSSLTNMYQPFTLNDSELKERFLVVFSFVRSLMI